MRDDRLVPIVYNGVPGPGTHDPKLDVPVPNFKISKPSAQTKQHADWKESNKIKAQPGPMTYTPRNQFWNKGQKMSTYGRQEDKGSHN